MADKCGAKTRAGGRCRKPKMPNGRCRFHGGMSTGPKVPNTRLNAFKLGLYSKQLLPEEVSIYRAIKLGNVDEELSLTRIRLRRALIAETAAAGNPELSEVITRDLVGVEGSARDEKSIVRDYSALIDKLTARIESLEKTRADLLKAAEGGDPDDDQVPIGKIILEVVSAKSSHDHDRAAG
jgi:hypothetical protein